MLLRGRLRRDSPAGSRPGLPPSATIPFLVDSRVAGAKYLVMLPAGEFTPADIELMGGPQAVTENDIEFAALPPISAADPQIAAYRKLAGGS